MTYRELLERYRRGELDPQQEETIRTELEKHEALGDFLFEETLEAAPGLSEQPPEEHAETQFTAEIRKTVRRTFWKLGVTVGISVLACTLFILFALPHIVDWFYYDPTERSDVWVQDDCKRPNMDLDVSVWTELFYPCGYRDTTTAQSLGYGRYLVTVQTGNTIIEKPNAVSGLLTRNRLTFFDPNAFSRASFLFLHPEDLGDTEEKRAEAKDSAFSMIEKQWKGQEEYAAYVTLAEPMDYETFCHWCLDAGIYQGHDLWCEVYTENPIWRGLGFSANPYSQLIDLCDQEQYPELVMGVEADMDGEAARQHFLSLLHYTMDHPDFTKIMLSMGETEMNHRLEQIAAQVEERGLSIRGFAIRGEKQDFMALEEKPEVCYIFPIVIA